VNWSSLFGQLLNGLVDASAMFLVAAGLSLIFGVTRIINFAHGSLYMVGLYLCYTLVHLFGRSGPGFWGAVVLSGVATGLLGAALEVLLLRRLYQASELLQLLATFALVLIISDAVLYLFGPDDLFAPRAPHLAGALSLFGRLVPSYDLILVFAGPLVLAGLWLLLRCSRFGRLIRAATQDRHMLAALGINQAWLFTAVFALGSALAGLGGALQSPRMPASLGLDLETVTTAFVVVVVGGMGSIPGAFVAAVVIGVVKALCVWLGTIELLGITIAMPRLTLVAEFIVMAVVLVWRPYGLLGRHSATVRQSPLSFNRPLASSRTIRYAALGAFVLLACVPLVADTFPYLSVILVEMLIAALYAASLYVLIGPSGMHSFGQAAYFGLGAYGAALLLKNLAVPMALCLMLAPLVAAFGALLFGWFCVRLSGIYLAMLTLAFAQIIWSVTYQWDQVTGGSNGLVGVWPAAWLAAPVRFYELTLLIVAAALLALRAMIFTPLGLTLRAVRDSPLRAAAIGIDPRHTQWLAFVVAGLFSGLAGALFAFSKGSISPDVMSVSRSVDGLVMVLLGGIDNLAGPWLGAAVFTWLSDTLARDTEYWRGALGMVILVLVLLLPEGLAGAMARLATLGRAARGASSGGHRAPPGAP
jgi:branched-chain amino acid transport system permease protein